MPKTLSDEQFKELKIWLATYDVNSNKLHREFSDAVAAANLLKKIYPKIIDLHNYPNRNSTKLKIENWETLNFKALNKLGLNQTKQTIDQLATATPGAIETFLYNVMSQEKDNKIREQEKLALEQENLWSENDDVMMVTVNKKIGDAIVQVQQKMILFSIHEELLRETSAKEAYLSAAKQKIAHLENISNLKTERIDELCEQLAKQSVRSLMSQQNNNVNSAVGTTATKRANNRTSRADSPVKRGAIQ